MANEFKHKDPGSELTQDEFIASDGTGHIFDSQATGDILYASSATVLKNLGKGAANTVLSMGGSCIPAWTASPSVTDLTIGGGCITLSAATDIDLLDNNASALSFDATGKTGIIDIVTTNGSEGVTMSGTLGVTGVLTATGGLAGGAICIGSSTITTGGLISGGSLDIDNVLIDGTTIGHTCDTDLLTLGNATLLAKGTVTVGVDGTGHDVTFYGDSPGAFMLYDQSADMLEIRGATTAGPGHLKLTTGEATVVACDVLGKIEFQAPAETGTDAIVVSASIAAVAQDTFAAAVNATDLVFYTGHSEVATEKFRFTSQNEIGVAGANYGTDGQVLTSGGAGAAVAWECAGGGQLVLLGTVEADGSAAAMNVTGLSATYESYLMVVNAQGTTNGAAWRMRLGCSGGIKTGACDYEWVGNHFLSSSCAYADSEDENDCEIQLFQASGNCGDEGIGATFWLHTDGACGVHPVITGSGVATYCSGVMASSHFGATLHTSVAVTQWQIGTRSGNVASGSRMTIFGLKHT